MAPGARVGGFIRRGSQSIDMSPLLLVDGRRALEEVEGRRSELASLTWCLWKCIFSGLPREWSSLLTVLMVLMLLFLLLLPLGARAL